MPNPNKDDFERTLQIAEFAVQRLENRRQYEFKVFISYTTLLILVIYKHEILTLGEIGLISAFSKNENLRGVGIVFIIIGLSVIHASYISWTIRLSVANGNDVHIRSFYMDKAMHICEDSLKKLGNPLCRTMESEYEFMDTEAKIREVPKPFGAFKYWKHLWHNYAATFQTILPFLLFVLLVYLLIVQ